MHHSIKRVATRYYAQTSGRIPPKSLLVKQADRLKRSQGHEGEGSQLMISSLKDIASMFQASSDTPEDEEREMWDHRNHLRQLIEAGELNRLLQDKFGLKSPNRLMSTALLMSQFPKLNNQQRDLIQEAVTMEPERSWGKIAPYMKQLQFYFSFGSFGPRRGLPFDTTHRPLDFTFILPSQTANNCKIKVHKLNRNQLVDLYSITKERKNIFNSKNLDIGSRCVIWSAILLALMVAFQEQHLKEDPDAKVNVLERRND